MNLLKKNYFPKLIAYFKGKFVENLLKLLILTSSIWLCLGGLLLIIDAFAL